MSRIYDIQDILEIIPQRPPFLMIDRFRFGEEPGQYFAVKNVTTNEPFFSGHFPGNPIMPGVLQLEAMLQAAGLAHKITEGGHGIRVLTSIGKVRFKNPVLPGEQLLIELKLSEVCPEKAAVEAIARSRAGKIFSTATFGIGLLDETKLESKSFTTTFKTDLFEPSAEKIHDINSITKLIPHRFPFHFIDSILYNGDQRTIGEKLVSINEPHCMGYIPAKPMCPSTVLIETAAQTACMYMLGKEENKNKLGLFMTIEDAIIHTPAIPGDVLTFDHEGIYLRSKLGRSKFTIYRGEEIIASMEMSFALVEKEAPTHA